MRAIRRVIGTENDPYCFPLRGVGDWRRLVKIIALDLGSNMALAHNGMGVPIVDHKTFEGHRTHRIYEIMWWIDKRFAEIEMECGADLVVFERPFARGMDATRSGWGIAGVIEALATKYGWPVTDTDPQTIKKFSTGNSRASKEQMIEAAQGMGYTGTNEHEADAFCLLKYAEKSATKLPMKGPKTCKDI